MNRLDARSFFSAARAILPAAVLVFISVQRAAGQGLEDAPYVPTPAVVKGTIGALQDPLEDVVRAAIQSLTDWRAVAAAPEMEKLLVAETTLAIRVEAFQFFVALGAGARPFLPALQPYLADSNPAVRERAVQAIAAAGAAAEYQVAVLPLLADPRKEVRVAAALCIGLAGVAAREHRDEIVQALLRAGSPEFKTALLDALTALGDLPPPVVDKILPFLADRSSEVRVAASAAVFRALFNAKAASAPVDLSAARSRAVQQFRQESPDVRGTILKHTIVDPETATLALATLAEELGEPEAPPRTAALVAMGLAGEVALPHLPRILAQYRTADAEQRAAVLAALRGIGPKAVQPNMELIMWAQLDPAEAVRNEALLALPLCGATLKNRPYRVLDVFQTAPPQVRQTLLKACAVVIQQLGTDDEAMDRLGQSLRDADAELRIAGCFVASQLGTRHGAPILPQVLRLAGDSDPAVQGAAAIALRSFADQPTAREQIRAALRPLLEHADDQVRWAALDTLIEAAPGQDVALVDRIAAMLNDPDRSVRISAVRALGSVGPAAKRHFAAIVGTFTDDPDVPPFAASRTVLELSPLKVTELTSLLQPIFLSPDVLPLVRLTAHGAAGGQAEGNLLLRLLGRTGRPVSETIRKEEIAQATAILAEASTAPSLHPKLREEIAARTAELKALGTR